MGVVAVAGRRVALREFREEDVPAIEAWCGEAGSPHPRSLSRARERAGSRGGVFVVEGVGEPESIGVVEYEVSDGWLAVKFIGLAKAYRGWGYGSEAVRLLEEWIVRERLAGRFRAEVAVGNGLGLYFWLRLGYRPEAATADERRREVLSMVREAYA